MTRLVYVVTSGVYSDYRIQAVYLNRTTAELHARLDDCRLEEYEVSHTAPALVELLTCRLEIVGGTQEPIEVTRRKAEVNRITVEHRQMKVDGITGRPRELIGAALNTARQELRTLINDPSTKDLERPAPILKRTEHIRWVELEDAHPVQVHDLRHWREEPTVSGTDFERVRKTFSEVCAQYYYDHPDHRETS